jgi:hypothetical protein
MRARHVLGICGALLLVSWPPRVSSNAGPVPIRILPQHVRIALEDDLDHYQVRAQYILENPGESREVEFSVPVQPSRPDGSPAADEIELQLDGTSQPCRSDASAPQAAACVALLSLPANAQIALELRQRGALAFQDVQTRARTRFGSRLLDYPLLSGAPAAASAAPQRLRVDVDLGRYTGLAVVRAPGGASEDGSHLRWELVDSDPTQACALALELDPAPLKEHEQLAHWNRDARQRGPQVHAVARASSELPDPGASRHGPERAVDGDPATAWCEGQPGDGAGAWIEIRASGALDFVPDGCHLEGLAITPGFARDQDSYLAHGRAAEVSLDRCYASASGPVTPIPELSERYDTSARFLPWQDPGDGEVDLFTGSRDPACIRMTLRRAVPGARYGNTCISEIAPVLACD